MTAAGLFVAIPAVLAYNTLTRANRLTLAALDAFAHDVHAYLSTGARLQPRVHEGGAGEARLAAQWSRMMAFGGFDQAGGNAPMSEINTTPLVDVMLVLLIIFMITAPLMTHAVKIDLPRPLAPRPRTSRKPSA